MKPSHLLIGLLFAFVFAASTPATAQPRGGLAVYDGLWSVLIVTEQGDCDRAYRYAVRIKNGQVRHANPELSSFDINGRVTKGGNVNVSVSRGDQRADGRGRITRDGGTGKWHSAKRECSGTWRAERRDSGDMTLIEGFGDQVNAAAWIATVPFRAMFGTDVSGRRRN